MKLKKLLSIVLAVAMIMGTMSFNVFADGETVGATEVGSYSELTAALADESVSNIILSEDIVASDGATLDLTGKTLDLGKKTLTINGESGKTSGTVIKNGTIEITTYDGDTVADGLFDVFGETKVEGVTFTSTKSAIYAIFDIKSGNLTLDDCVITMSNNDADGGLFYDNSGNGGYKLVMNKTNVTLTDIGDFISNGIVELNDCNIEIRSVEGGLDNGINGAALTLNNTNVTIDGAAGRGITTDGDDIVIKGTSKVNLTNCAEGGLRYKASANVIVEDTATLITNVKVDSAATDAKINNESIAVTVDNKLVDVNASSEKVEKATDTEIIINLISDATLDITAWQALAIGGDSTETITINGNGNTLTFNHLNNDWNNVATKNNAKLILNNMNITNSGYNDGPWNRHDINFGCDVELNNVTSDKALAFKADATLKNVTVNDNGDVYAIWIQANGQQVDIDGLTVNAGRGIKIDEQYVTAKKVNLNVEDATFETSEKAAILVKSAAGADITASGTIDISKVAADSKNLVWVDEDSAGSFGKITVSGASLSIEGGLSAYPVGIVAEDELLGYYKTIEAAVDAASDGNIITLLGDTTEDVTIEKDVTIDLNQKTLNGAILAGSKGNITVKNGSIKNNNPKNSAIEINKGTLNVENVDIESERHAIRIDGDVTATINGGTYKVLVNTKLSCHAVNVSGDAEVTIKDGTFYGPKGTPNGSAMGGSAVNSYGDAVVTIEGGKFTGGVNNTINGNVSIKGGSFDQDMTAYVADGYESLYYAKDALYKVILAAASSEAEGVKIDLVATSDANVYDIMLASSDGTSDIYEFIAAQLEFDNQSENTDGPGSMKYIVTANDDLGIVLVENAGDSDVYGFHIADNAKRISAKEIKLGQIEFVGNGTIDLEVAKDKTVVTATLYHTNDEYYFKAADNNLTIGTKANGAIDHATYTNLDVNIDFVHDTETGKDAAYNAITVTVTGPLGYKKVGKVGLNATDADVSADVINNKVALTFPEVVVGYRYNVKLEAPGYRTFSYNTVVEEEGKSLLFWNDAKTGKDEDPLVSIETGKTPTDVTFLVGDIAMDYIIDKYDLAAVTSYYGTYNITNSNLVKYDLNRDGDIDIIDIGYVIHGLGY